MVCGELERAVVIVDTAINDLVRSVGEGRDQAMHTSVVLESLTMLRTVAECRLSHRKTDEVHQELMRRLTALSRMARSIIWIAPDNGQRLRIVVIFQASFAGLCTDVLNI